MLTTEVRHQRSDEGYNCKGSYRVWIPRIGAREITFYEGSLHALVMVGSKLVTVDCNFLV